MAGDGGWVGGLVELEVLGVVGGLGLLGVVLGHRGRVLGVLGGRDGLRVVFSLLGVCGEVFVRCEAGLAEAVTHLVETCVF